MAGNPNGNVAMVEFFDYNCPWCKKDFADVMALISEDKELKVVLFPGYLPKEELGNAIVEARAKGACLVC